MNKLNPIDFTGVKIEVNGVLKDVSLSSYDEKTNTYTIEILEDETNNQKQHSKTKR